MRRGGLLTMYIVKLPSGEYINLAFIQRVQVDKQPSTVLIHWSGGGKDIYHNEDAKAIIKLIDKFLDPDISFSLPSDRAEEIALDIFNTFNPDAKTT